MNESDISDIVEDTNSCRCHHIVKALVVLNYSFHVEANGVGSIEMRANRQTITVSRYFAAVFALSTRVSTLISYPPPEYLKS